jgi:hypothetical protein
MKSRRPVNCSAVGHLPMRLNRIHALALMILFAGCIKPPIITPSSQAEADKAIDHEQARRLSDSIADHLLKNDRPMLRNSMEKGSGDYYDDAAFAS